MTKRDYVSEITKVSEKMDLVNKTVEFFKIQIEEEINRCVETEKYPKSFSFEEKMNEHKFKMGLILNKLHLEEKEITALEKSVIKLKKKYKRLL